MHDLDEIEYDEEAQSILTEYEKDCQKEYLERQARNYEASAKAYYFSRK